MARKVTQVVEFTDDLDGSKADQTVAFSWDGTSYEIDLSKKNATAFQKAVKPYVDSARKVRSTRPGRSRSSGKARNGKEQLAAIRQWAKENGYQVAERGRISSEVVEAYNSAS